LTELVEDELRAELARDFVESLGDAEPAVRDRAGAALVRLGSPAVDPLRAIVGDRTDVEARFRALEVIAALGPSAKAALPELRAALVDPDPANRGEAAVALAALGPEASSAVAELQAVLADEDGPPQVRYAAAYALGSIGPASRPAIEWLHALSESPDELMATVATWAVLKIAPEDRAVCERAVPLLERALSAESELARLEAAVALGDLGAMAATAAPTLELVARDDPSRTVREAAAESLRRVRTTP